MSDITGAVRRNQTNRQPSFKESAIEVKQITEESEQ